MEIATLISMTIIVAVIGSIIGYVATGDESEDKGD